VGGSVVYGDEMGFDPPPLEQDPPEPLPPPLPLYRWKYTLGYKLDTPFKYGGKEYFEVGISSEECREDPPIVIPGGDFPLKDQLEAKMNDLGIGIPIGPAKFGYTISYEGPC